jgi:23S rRNA (adenine-N6)-dimethyltransferase
VALRQRGPPANRVYLRRFRGVGGWPSARGFLLLALRGRFGYRAGWLVHRETGVLMDGSPRRGGGPRTARDIRRRVLSQNLLREGPGVDAFMNALDVGQEDLVVEVGAGRGILTRRLAAVCGRLVAYEVDPDMARQLLASARDQPNVRIVADDFLASRAPAEPFKLVGNVPFSLTSPIIDWCLSAPTIESATLITQLEYARKRTGDYGRWSLLTVRTWPWVSWELRGTIARKHFSPVPRVDAGILRLTARTAPLLPRGRRAAYDRMVNNGFSGVGGSLNASLARHYPVGRVTAAFRTARVERNIVVAYVTPEQWLAIFNALEG